MLAQDEKKKKEPLLHVLVVTYEFTFSPFSGNGILARSLVKSLLEIGCRVTVWCCRPQRDQHVAAAADAEATVVTRMTSFLSSDHHLEPPEISTQQAEEQLQVFSVQLSHEQGWKRLDDESSWQDFVWNNLDDSKKELFKRALQTVDIQCAIDWTGAHALRSVPKDFLCSSNDQQHQQQQQDDAKCTRKYPPPSRPPFMYLNFRVYSSGVPDESKHQWYDDMESMALTEADFIVALSHKDVASLQAILEQGGCNKDNDVANNNSNKKKKVHFLLPPLRNDMERLACSRNPAELVAQHLPKRAADAIVNYNSQNPASPAISSQQERVFVTCVVRLSPEKEAMRFVDFVQANQDLFQSTQLLLSLSSSSSSLSSRNKSYIALLAGATGDTEYAAKIHKRLQEIVANRTPACHVVVLNDSFLSPPSLAAVFMRTALNFHPCSYDAYGMTVIEAAAFGVPSVIASGKTSISSAVGASAIVGNGASIPVDFGLSNDSWHGTVRDALSRPQELQEIGALARHRAFSWDETAYGAKLLEYMQRVLKEKQAVADA